MCGILTRALSGLGPAGAQHWQLYKQMLGRVPNGLSIFALTVEKKS